MWTKNWRDEIWSQLNQDWDVLVVGGGITGAGIMREATRHGLRTLLVEKRDFGWGTSSRSSKLVHGGLRYLKERKVRLTRDSVHERERLLDEGPGLIDPLGFLLATYEGDRPGRWTYGAGLSVYDLLALQWSHRHYSAEDFQMLAPHITQAGLKGGFRYGDAQTDDARLVLRLIREAVADGAAQPASCALALNYVAAERVLRDTNQRAAPVIGVRLRDETACGAAVDRTADVYAKVVINATGAWADRLRKGIGAQPCIRPLRGSHLIFPSWRLPVAQAVSFLHPVDQRPVFIFPWEGITLVGTTDVDHHQPLDDEPCISPEEVAYLMAAVEGQFPSLQLSLDDVISTFAGVRPVIGTGKEDPSRESRDHVVWDESGLLTVTGGKLTTFRLIALDALKVVRHRLPELPPIEDKVPVLNPVDVDLPEAKRLDETARRRLLGRYATDAPALVAAAKPDELEPIPGTQTLWAEVRWGARAEGVVHLDDLLLRRVRLGHLLPRGGESLLPGVRAICQSELGWDDARWEREERAYLDLWLRCYSQPDRESIPDWRAMLAEARAEREATRPIRRRRIIKRSAIAGILIGLALVSALLYRHCKKS
ncbi:MAG TPA: glycerol-3-phosphate dehydrogenase/oxidase [Anaerolineae bacterium]|nr:glycerol-3-phosphate dehydrogenase/oxidase [Anaerolineae bacterium]